MSRPEAGAGDAAARTRAAPAPPQAQDPKNALAEVARLVDRNAATLVKLVESEEALLEMRRAHAAAHPGWQDGDPDPPEIAAHAQSIRALEVKYQSRLRVLSAWVDRTQPALMRERGATKVATGLSEPSVVSVPEAQPAPSDWDKKQGELWAQVHDVEEQAEPAPLRELPDDQ